MQKSLDGTLRNDLQEPRMFVLKYHMYTYHRETCYAPKAGGEVYGSFLIFTGKKGWTMHALGESWKSKCASIILSHDENPRELQAIECKVDRQVSSKRCHVIPGFSAWILCDAFQGAANVLALKHKLVHAI